MTRLSNFNSPFLLGFEHLERVLENVSKSSADGYPPYNIEQIGDACLRITLAVAGFGTADISVVVEDRQLVIRGRRPEEAEGRTFLHRGIAARQFQRMFVLADGIEVTDAVLDNGLLHVNLRRRPLEPKVRKITVEKRRPAADAIALSSRSPDHTEESEPGS